MALISDIVYSAQRLLGISDLTNTVRLSEALTAFNNMIKDMDLKYAPTEEVLSVVIGTASYTIGSGGVFNTTRPAKLVSAFLRSATSVDYPIDVTMSKQDYDMMASKVTARRPDQLYYAPEYPLGKIYFNFVPIANENFYLTSIKPFTAYTALSDTLLFPVEWELALIYNLALALAPEYEVQMDQTVIEKSVLYKVALKKDVIVMPQKVNNAV